MTGDVESASLVTYHASLEVIVRGRLYSFIVRSAIAFLIAWFIATVPLPVSAPNTWWTYVKVAVVVFILICYIGKLMIDTFFYNHYKP